MLNQIDYDEQDFNLRYVFGVSSPSSTDYNSHIRFTNDEPDKLYLNMLEYLTRGGGRYAYPSIFEGVDKFFSMDADVPDGVYRLIQRPNNTLILVNVNDTNQTVDLNLRRGDFLQAISQYGTDIGNEDHEDRSFLFGSTGFELNFSNATFEVVNGFKTIKNFEVIARNDNYDFNAGDGFAQKFNGLIFEPIIDPYRLGTELDIIYTGNGLPYSEYSRNQYVSDNIFLEPKVSLQNSVRNAAGIVSLGIANLNPDPFSINPLNVILNIPQYVENIISDPFLSYIKDDFLVIYGSSASDGLTPLSAAAVASLTKPVGPYFFVGGAGGDVIISSLTSDELLGGRGRDLLQGGIGNDTLNGNQDIDSAIFSGEFEDYEYSVSADDQIITFEDTVSNFFNQDDGTDVLKNIEFAQFEDLTVPLPLEDGAEVIINETLPSSSLASVSLTLPQSVLDGDADYTIDISSLSPSTTYNIALAIDTSASQNQSLQNSQNASVGLINSLIDQGLADISRFQIISFNDNATSQRNLTATQAINAINSLSTGGNATESTIRYSFW